MIEKLTGTCPSCGKRVGQAGWHPLLDCYWLAGNGQKMEKI